MCFRPDGVGTVLSEEREKFDDVKTRLRALLEYQIVHFRFVVPHFAAINCFS